MQELFLPRALSTPGVQAPSCLCLFSFLLLGYMEVFFFFWKSEVSIFLSFLKSEVSL